MQIDNDEDPVEYIFSRALNDFNVELAGHILAEATLDETKIILITSGI